MQLFRVRTEKSAENACGPSGLTKIVMASATFLCGALGTTNSAAGGLIGDAISWVGDRTGLQPLQQLGPALDHANDQLKDLLPLYKQAEESGSQYVRQLFQGACESIYQAYTNTVIAGCSNYGGRLEGSESIRQSEQLLIQLGFYKPEHFTNVEIRMCPLHGLASGITPDRDKVYLDTGLLDGDIGNLVLTLGHEMVHVGQYVSMGTDSFKCKYSTEYLQHGTGRGNSLEGAAYATQDAIYGRLHSNPATPVTAPVVLTAEQIQARLKTLVRVDNKTSKVLAVYVESEHAAKSKATIHKGAAREFFGPPNDEFYNVEVKTVDTFGEHLMLYQSIQAGYEYHIEPAPGDRLKLLSLP